MNVTITNLEIYLAACEEKFDFLPWEDDKHVITTLMTTFGVSKEEATAAVAAYKPATMEVI